MNSDAAFAGHGPTQAAASSRKESLDGSVSNLTEGSVLVDAVAEAPLLPFGLNNDLDQHGTKSGLPFSKQELGSLFWNEQSLPRYLRAKIFLDLTKSQGLGAKMEK
jgi:hypothetical protein